MSCHDVDYHHQKDIHCLLSLDLQHLVRYEKYSCLDACGQQPWQMIYPVRV